MYCLREHTKIKNRQIKSIMRKNKENANCMLLVYEEIVSINNIYKKTNP